MLPGKRGRMARFLSVLLLAACMFGTALGEVESMTMVGNGAIATGLYWEQEIIVVYEPEKGGVWYPRLYALQNGDLLCAFDTNEDGGRAEIKLLRSHDGGLTWGEKAEGSGFPELDCANPAFIQLPDGALWLAYRANVQKGDDYYSSIRCNVSYDNGETWEFHSMVAEELGIGGVYEPHFGMIGDKVAVFYANDSRNAVNEHMEQNIEFKLWQDDGWSEKHIASDGRETHSRDGMPVWDRMADGGYALVIEATNVAGHPFVIQMKTSPDGLDWQAENRNIYIPYMEGKKAGAPYVATLPDGRLAVAFQTDDEAAQTGDHASYMQVMVSTDESHQGETFSEPFIPFLMPEGRCANWNALYVYEGYLYALTSANYPRSGIYLRRASLAPDTRPGQNVITNGDFRFKNTQGFTICQGDREYHGNFAAKRFEGDGENWHLLLMNNKTTDITLKQEIPGVEAGVYSFSVIAWGDGGEVRLRLTQGDETVETALAVDAEPRVLKAVGITLADGPVEVAIVQPGGLRNLHLDDITLVKEAEGN